MMGGGGVFALLLLGTCAAMLLSITLLDAGKGVARPGALLSVAPGIVDAPRWWARTGGREAGVASGARGRARLESTKGVANMLAEGDQAATTSVDTQASPSQAEVQAEIVPESPLGETADGAASTDGPEHVHARSAVAGGRLPIPPGGVHTHTVADHMPAAIASSHYHHASAPVHGASRSHTLPPAYTRSAVHHAHLPAAQPAAPAAAPCSSNCAESETSAMAKAHHWITKAVQAHRDVVAYQKAHDADVRGWANAIRGQVDNIYSNPPSVGHALLGMSGEVREQKKKLEARVESVMAAINSANADAPLG